MFGYLLMLKSDLDKKEKRMNNISEIFPNSEQNKFE